MNKSIFKDTYLITISSFLSALIGVIRNKCIVIFLGAAGLGFSGIILAFSNILSTIFLYGINPNIIRTIAASEDKGRDALIIIFLGIFLTIVTFAFVFTLIFFNQSIIPFETNIFEKILIALNSAFLVLSAVFTAINQGYRKSIYIFNINFYGSFFSCILGVLSVIYLERLGLIIILLLIPMFVSIIGFINIRDVINSSLPSEISYVRNILRRIYKSSLPILLAALLTFMGQYFIRYTLNLRLGIDFTGVYHGIWLFSLTTFGILLNSMASEYMPRLSLESHDDLNSVIADQSKLINTLIFPFILFVYLFGYYILLFLYDENIASYTDFLKLHLIGDTLKILIWPASYLLLAKGKNYAFFISELIFNFSFLLLFTLLINNYSGQSAIGYAYVSAYFLYSMFIYFYIKKEFKFNITILQKENIQFIILIIVLFIFSNHLFVGILNVLFLFIFSFKLIKYLLRVLKRK